MTTRTWAEKKVEKAWQKHRGGLLDFTSGLIVSEHARAVRIVEAEIKRVKMDQHSYSVVTKGELLASLNKLLAALQRGRTRGK